MFCLIHMGDSHLKINRPSFPELFICSERAEMRVVEMQESHKLNRGLRVQDVSIWCPFAACVYMPSTVVPRHFTGCCARFLTAIWGFWHEMTPRASRWADSTGQSERSRTEVAANAKKLIKTPKRMQNPLLIQLILTFSLFLYIYIVVQLPS